MTSQVGEMSVLGGASMHNILIFLLLLGVANGTPILLRLIFGTRYARPLDGGLRRTGIRDQSSGVI